MKRAAAFILALGLLAALAGCGTGEAEVTPSEEPSAEPTPVVTPEPSAEATPAETPEPYEGTIFLRSEQDGFSSTYEGYIVLLADAMLPTVTIEGRDEAAAAITSALQKRLAATESSTREAYKAACEAFDALDEAGREIWLAYGWSSSGEVARGDGAVLSLLCSTYAYTGGAHGSYEYFGQTYSTVTGKALSLNDLAADPAALREALAQAVTAQAAQDEEELFDIEGFTERVFDTEAWYLTDEALVIVAQVGEVAAGARGRVEFAVPYSELQGLLKSEYLPAVKTEKGGAGDLSIAFSDDAADVPVAAETRILRSGSEAEYLTDCRIIAAEDMGPIALRGSIVGAADSVVFYEQGEEYAWINRLDAGEALKIVSVFMDTPQFCLVLDDGTVLQIAQSGEDGSLLLYEAEG